MPAILALIGDTAEKTTIILYHFGGGANAKIKPREILTESVFQKCDDEIQ